MTWLLPILELISGIVGLFREERLRADGARAQREKDDEAAKIAETKMNNIKEDDAAKRLKEGSF